MVTIDMVGDMKDIMDFYNQLRQNPMQILNKRFNIPQNVNMSNPDDILQYLMNSGQVTQNQINNVMQMRDNPMIRKLMGR